MAIGTVNEIVDAYRSNPAPLAERYNVDRQLVDLLALQQINTEQQAIANQMDMDLQQQAMASGQGADIAQQTAQETLDLTSNNMMRMAENAGLGGLINQRNSEMAAAGGGMLRRGGLDHIPSNIQKMSSGGIIAFANGTGDDVVRNSASENIEIFETLLDREGVNDPQEREFLKAIYAQESSSGTDPAIWEGEEYKDTGAEPMGGMQVSDIAFQDIDNEGLDRTSVVGNLIAGIRYGRKMYDQADGDPALAAAGYYGGPDSIDIVRSGGGDRLDSDQPDFPTLVEYGEDIVSRMGGESPSDIGVAQQIADARESDTGGITSLINPDNPYGTSKRRGTWQDTPTDIPPTFTTTTYGDDDQFTQQKRTSVNPLGQVGGGPRSEAPYTAPEDQMGRRGEQARAWSEGGEEIAQRYADAMAEGTIPPDSPFFNTTNIRRALSSDNPELTPNMRRALVEKIGDKSTDWIDELPPYELNPLGADLSLGTQPSQTGEFRAIAEAEPISNVDKLKSVTMGQADTLNPPPNTEGIASGAGIDWLRLQNALAGGAGQTSRSAALSGIGQADVGYQLQQQKLAQDVQLAELTADVRRDLGIMQTELGYAQVAQRAAQAEATVNARLMTSLINSNAQFNEAERKAADDAWADYQDNPDHLLFMAKLNDLPPEERDAAYANYVRRQYESYGRGRAFGLEAVSGGGNTPQVAIGSGTTISNSPSGT